MGNKLEDFGFKADEPAKLEDFGFKADAPTAPAEVQAAAPRPDLRSPQAAQEPLSSLKGPQNSPRMGQALLRGALGGSRFIEDLLTRQGKLGKTTPSNLDQFAPALQNPSAGEQAAEMAGSIADPVALTVGGVLGKGSSMAYEAFSPLERKAAQASLAFEAENTAKTASDLYKASMANNVAKSATEGLAFGAGYTGAETVAAGNDDYADVAKKMLVGGLTGSALGAAGSAISSYLKGKPKFKGSEVVHLSETPATQALDNELSQTLAEHSRLSEQEQNIVEAAQGRIAKTESSHIDEAAQKAARIEDNHKMEVQQLSQIQERLTDPATIEHIDNAKNQSFGRMGTELNDVSTSLNSRLESLDAQRKNIIGSLGEADAKTLENTREKLQNLNGRMAQLQEARDGLTATLAVPKEGSIEYQSNLFIKDAKDIAATQVAKVNEAVKKGLLTESQAVGIRKAEWDNTLSLLGVDLDKKSVWNLGEIFGKQVDYANMDEKLGVRTGEVWNELMYGRSAAKNYGREFSSKVNTIADGLNKLGLADDQISHAMQYVESGGFNPNAVESKSISRLPWQGPLPSAEQLQGLSTMRQLFDEARQQAVSKGLTVGHVEGYLPLMQKQGLGGYSGTSGEAIRNPQFTQNRSSGFLDPETMETNIRAIGERYGKQVGKAAYLKDPFDKGMNEYLKLKMQGNGKEADRWARDFFRANGVSDIKTGSELMSSHAVDANYATISRLADMTENSQGFVQEVHKEVQNLMYGTLVTSNPSTILKQYLQPNVLGPAELGHANVEISRLIALGPKSELKARAEGLMKYVLQDEMTNLTEQELLKPKSLVGKTLRAAGIVLEPTNKIYGSAEKLNRMTAVIGGIRNFEAAVKNGTVDQVLTGLASFEKARVMATLEKLGPTEAANLFGIIKNNRVNFLFDNINKPELLQSKLGNLVPFTGFARGIADGIATNVISGNYKQLAKMVAYPLALGTIVTQLTGKDISGVNPIEAATGVLTPSIAPQITGPMQVLSKTKSPLAAGKEYLTKYTPYAAAARLMKAKSAGELFGVKDKDKVPGYIKQLSKDIGVK